MRIEGEYTFKAPRELVYDLLQDPDALAQAMPGKPKLEQVSENKYEAKMKVKIGPIKGEYGGAVVVEDAERPTHFRLVVSGKGSTGFLKGEGTVDLEEADEGKTTIRYAGETQVGGKIAQVGQRLVQSVARKMINKGLKSLEKQLAEKQAA